MKKNSALMRDTKNIVKHGLKDIIFTGILLGFLFYIFNIFSGLLIKEDKISETITSKVGMYFYIQDDSNSNDIYKRIIGIKDKLAEKGIKSEFSSKNDAFNYLETKIPDITENFEKFGIDNTLPSTLYIMFKDKEEYNIMKEIIVENKDIILNVKDVEKGATLQQQENRSLKIIEIVSTIKNMTRFMILIISIIIITFTQHLLQHFFYDFYKEIQVKKLLGATRKDANGGFMITLTGTIIIGFIIGYILSLITFNVLNHHLVSIGVNIALANVMRALILPLFVFIIIARILGYRMLIKMEKKL